MTIPAKPKMSQANWDTPLVDKLAISDKILAFSFNQYCTNWENSTRKGYLLAKFLLPIF